MANIIDNLKVGTPENNKNIKTILIKLHKDSEWQKLKEFFFNGVLIWKNANPFIFTKDHQTIDLSAYGVDTIIFEGFSEEEFIGSYSIVDNAEAEKINLVEGQMVVENTMDGDN